jgi:hypothetical protein
MLGFVGDTSIETSVAGVTVSVVLPETNPDVAVIVAEPARMVVARPLEPCALLTVATAVFDEFQVTVAVMSWLELSEKMPVAVNCLVVPSAMLGFVGVTSTDTSVSEFTVRSVLPDMPLIVALIVAVPALTEVASPLEPAVLLTVATEADELQVTDAVRSWFV